MGDNRWEACFNGYKLKQNYGKLLGIHLDTLKFENIK